MGINRLVNITVIGDEGVGKTSLITAAATECFSDNPPPVLPPAKLPAESTPENVPITITDTSSRPEDRPALEQAVKTSNVVVLAFDCARHDTLERCGSYWMRELHRLQFSGPVVLVGCKSDLRSVENELHKSVVSVVSSNKQIEICLECSARNLQFVGEVFYYALKSVNNPIGPLFDPETSTLKSLCVRALKRVFMMCDKDKDKVLNDAELNAFQVRCFNAPLAPDELAAVKKVVAEKLPQGVTSTGGLTFHGFLFLHALFIERGRTETPWAVLRSFGYDNFLKLSDEVLDQVSFKHGPDQVVELTDVGINFLCDCFDRFDSHKEGVLTKADQEEMFSTAPSSPWTGRIYERLLVECGHGGAVTRNGFLGKWVYTTAVDPRKTLAYMLYLGFEGDLSTMFNISRPRKQERRSEQSRRRVFQSFVFGPPEAGKTCLLRKLANIPQPPNNSAAAKEGCHIAIGKVDTDTGTDWLIMREIDEAGSSGMLTVGKGSEELHVADVAVFVFDSSDPDSFEFSSKLLIDVAMSSGDSLPCVLVATKDDLGMHQDALSACTDTCAALCLRPPIHLSMRLGDASSAFVQIIDAALHPALTIPETPSLKSARRYRAMLRRAVLYVAGGTLAGAAAYGVYKLYKSQSCKDNVESWVNRIKTSISK